MIPHSQVPETFFSCIICYVLNWSEKKADYLYEPNLITGSLKNRNFSDWWQKAEEEVMEIQRIRGIWHPLLAWRLRRASNEECGRHLMLNAAPTWQSAKKEDLRLAHRIWTEPTTWVSLQVILLRVSLLPRTGNKAHKQVRNKKGSRYRNAKC